MAKKITIDENQLTDIINDVITEVSRQEPNHIIFEMARIRQPKSGLPMLVWLNPDDGTNTGNHNAPRLKFQDNTNTKLMPQEMVPMSIHPSEPKILVKNYKTKLPAKSINQLKEWVVLNYETLMAYWNNEIYEDELIEILQKYDK